MAAGDRGDRVTAVLVALWAVLLPALAGWAETVGQRVAALLLVAASAAAPALTPSKKTFPRTWGNASQHCANGGGVLALAACSG